jgi:long-chain acyl-CoA synthetase
MIRPAGGPGGASERRMRAPAGGPDTRPMRSALAHLLDPHVADAPDRVALAADGRDWAYRELAAAAGALAAAMRADGLAGERVAVFLPNSAETVLAYLGCFGSGAVATPLNSRYAPPELERALRRARPRWLVTHADRLDRVAAVDPAALAGVRVLVTGGDPGPHEPFGPLLETAPVPGPASDGGDPDGGDPAVMFFTSGSTGTPKGVLHTHASALAMVDSTAAAFEGTGPDDVTLVCEPQVHVSGFIGTFSTLRGGGRVDLYDGFQVDRYVHALRTRRPTLVCTHIDVLAQVVRAPGAETSWFSSLRGAYTGGDTVPAALQRDFLRVAGLPIAVGWGMTEAIWLTVVREPHLERDGCVGVPVGGAEVRADPETGELQVRGPMLMRCYWEDPGLTAAAVRDGWLGTGDTGERDADGLWWFTGRIKDIIVRRTSKITPGEVESALDEHPDVALAAVIGVPDPDEGQVPVAFVVPRPGRSLDPDELTAFLAGRIAAYKRPARVHVRDALPLTASGKVAHRELRESDPGLAPL